nr:hypothetical protein [Tanacetum cinerariifolium]
MGDANPIRTLGDYSKPSHEGYRNTIELPEGNNVLITGRLVNGSSCGGSDMVIKDLDFEPKVDAVMRDFLEVLWSFPMERIEQENE